MAKLNTCILINSNQPENRYGRFAREILVSEGLTGFSFVDLADGRLPEFEETALILVTRAILRRAQADALLEAVRRGAGAVFLQPQQWIVEQLGFAVASSVIYPGTVRIRYSYGGTGLSLQTHLPIPRYVLPAGPPDWLAVADALNAEWHETGHPAAATAPCGRGRVTLFFYDLAEAVARIRFGNPDLSGYTTSATWPWPHALDLFEGHLDPRAAHLPQADLHSQLLARMLTGTAPFPLARLWYYAEAAHRTAGVFESDGDYSEPGQFRALAAALEKRGGAATFYLMRATKLSETDVAELRARGHSFGPHADPLARDEELAFALPDALREETGKFAARFGAVSPTLQCHCAPWPGYMSPVPAHIENGYRLLFAYLPGSCAVWGRYLCGSGRPMRFCGLDGAIYDCWQQPLVIFDDETLIAYLRDRADVARRVFDTALDAVLTHSHTGVPILSHPVSFCTYSRPVMEHVFDRLHAAGAPLYNADAWLQFTDWRANTRVAQDQDGNGHFVCTVSGLQGRIPLMFPVKNLAPGATVVAINGHEASHSLLRRLGDDYLFVQLDAKEHGPVARVSVRADRL